MEVNVLNKGEAVTVPSGYQVISENGCFLMYLKQVKMKVLHLIGFCWPGMSKKQK